MQPDQPLNNSTDVLPLARSLIERFATGKDFWSSQLHSFNKAGRFAARAGGVPVIADLFFEEKACLFRSFEQVIAIVPTTIEASTKIERNKAKSVIENELARERITEHCIECEFFSFSGMVGPVCAKIKGSGCQCKEYKDPKWGCPLPVPKFKPVSSS